MPLTPLDPSNFPLEPLGTPVTPNFIPWDPLDIPLYPKDVLLDPLKATKSPELTYESSEDPLNVFDPLRPP